jgi:hypothetical protein
MQREDTGDRRGGHFTMCSGAGEPSDHTRVGIMKTVSGSRGPPSCAKIGDPGRLAPHDAVDPRGRKNIKCGRQCPSASERTPCTDIMKHIEPGSGSANA